LPEHQRAALLLREGEELSYGEIARVLCISEAKVKVDIYRARQALRRSWSETIEHSAQSCDEKVESSC
jgi:RNA polymerase sigma-70 factor (ECF subfamily)